MARVKVLVPQLYLGRSGIRVLRILKQPGEHVERREPVYELKDGRQIRTVESPCQGILTEWLVQEGDVVTAGAAVVRIHTEQLGVADPRSQPSASPVLPSQNAGGTREHRDVALGTAAASNRRSEGAGPLRISNGGEDPGPLEEIREVADRPDALTPVDAGPYPPVDGLERDLSPRQRLLVQRFRRSQESVIPATVACRLDASLLDRGVQSLRRKTGVSSLYEFELLALCVARASREFPKFRSRMLNDRTVREFSHLNLGIAVACGDDDLVTAVIPAADTLEVETFIETLHKQVQLALDGQDQATSHTQFVLSYMGSHYITDCTPILVAPAVGVLLVGSRFEQGDRVVLKLNLTFEHRLISGITAANFLHAIDREAALIGPDTKRGDRSVANGDRARLLTSELRKQVGSMLNIPVSEVDPQKPLASLGLTSLKFLELGNWITGQVGFDVSPTFLWCYPTIQMIASHLTDGDGESTAWCDSGATRQRESAKQGDTRRHIQQISEEDAKSLLLRELDDQDPPE